MLLVTDRGWFLRSYFRIEGGVLWLGFWVRGYGWVGSVGLDRV